ncbi:MAG: 2-hydroxychromene-2-carboxylate isomerase [Kiloniellales bacterium]
MTKIVDYYLSLNSPYAYLGSREFEAILERQSAQARVKPISLAKIFPESGGLPLPKRAPQRQAYRLVELERWAKARGLALNLHPKFFPAAEEDAARLVAAAEANAGDPLELTHAILRGVWAEERNIADGDTLQALARESGHDAAKLSAQAKEPQTLAAFEQHTQEALKRGVFGSPTYVYKDELFWGQDRLDFLERALAT